MPSKIREAALLLDFTSTLWRFAATQDQTELTDLLPEQLHMLAKRFPEGSAEHAEILELIAHKAANP